MRLPDKIFLKALQPFEPEPHAIYTLEAAAHITRLPRRTIVVCCKHGLVSPVGGPAGGYYFDDESMRTLRRIEFLHDECGVNLTGTKMILDLTREVERLRSQLQRSGGAA